MPLNKQTRYISIKKMRQKAFSSKYSKQAIAKTTAAKAKMMLFSNKIFSNSHRVGHLGFWQLSKIVCQPPLRSRTLSVLGQKGNLF
jgi:hypothetical protein